jgi:hypothetical protein
MTRFPARTRDGLWNPQLVLRPYFYETGSREILVEREGLAQSPRMTRKLVAST